MGNVFKVQIAKNNMKKNSLFLGRFIIFFFILFFISSGVKAVSDEQQKISETENVVAFINGQIPVAERNCIEIPETLKLLEEIKTLYNQSRFEEAYSKSLEIKLTYALETKGEFNFLCWIKHNPSKALIAFWPITLLLAIILAGLLIFIFLQLKKKND